MIWRLIGNAWNAWKTSISPRCSPSHWIRTGVLWISVVPKSWTRTAGDRMAHWRAAPRDTASSWFNVVLTDLPKTCSINVLTIGIRVLPPTISIAWISSDVSSKVKGKRKLDDDNETERERECEVVRPPPLPILTQLTWIGETFLQNIFQRLKQIFTKLFHISAWHTRCYVNLINETINVQW